MVSVPRYGRLLVAIPLVAALIGGLKPGCGDEESCIGPGASLDTSTDTMEGQLPSWAVGGFGYHGIDLTNYLIEPDGEGFYVLDGGDFISGCIPITALFIDGRVHVLFWDETLQDSHTVFVRDTEGRVYQGRSDGTDLTCGWCLLEQTNLCGRDVGGCGGYGSAVACSWEEVRRRACEGEGDGSGDQGGDMGEDASDADQYTGDPASGDGPT